MFVVYFILFYFILIFPPKPILLFFKGQSSDNAHLANERIRLQNLLKGEEVIRVLFKKLGTALLQPA